MIDFISPFISLLWPIVLAAAAFIGLFAWGAKKKRDGRIDEQARAREAKDKARDEAVVIREKAATKPTSQKRKETTRWEL